MIYPVSYSTLKTYSQTSGLVLRWLEESSAYTVFILDDHLMLTTTISRESSSSDLTDFEANVKPIVTPPYGQLDTDGAKIVRFKAAKRGWSYLAIPIEFTTSTIGASLFSQDADGNSRSWISGKIYNGAGAEITVPGLLDVNLATATKTIIDFEPPYNYEIIGGSIRINSNPATDVRLWIIGAPDIPAQYGGSKEFISGINTKFMSADNTFQVDGRVTKAIAYDPNNHQGKFRLILKHGAGQQINFMIVMELYRQ